MTMIGKQADFLHGIPRVSSSAERDVRFPSPDTHQRVENAETGFQERYDGANWVQGTPSYAAGPIINVMSQGAKGDGSTDDSGAIAAAEALAFASGGFLYFPPKTFNIGTTGLTIRCGIAPGSEFATINYAGTGTAVVYGSTTSGTPFRKLRAHFPQIVQTNKAAMGWAQAGGADIGLQIINVIESELHVPHVHNFSVGLDVYGKGTGAVYNNIFVGHLDNNKVNHQIDSDSTGWSNENNYYGGRYGHESAEGTNVSGTRQVYLPTATNAPNNNRWWGASLEGNVPEYHVDCFGSYNLWLGCRWEASSPKVKFDGANAFANAIIQGYNADAITFTVQNGAFRNQLISANRNRQYGSAGSAGLVVLSSSSSSTDPLLAGLAAAADPLTTTLSTDYNWRITANRIEGKRTADTNPRVQIDFQNGRVWVCNGSGTPSAGLAAFSTDQITITGMNLPVTSKAFADSPYTALTTDTTIRVDTSGGSVTINLPSASNCTGHIYAVKKTTTDANTVTLDPNGAQTIDGAATYVIAGGSRGSALIQSNGTSWDILST